MKPSTYNCLLIDDEYLALDLLENYLMRIEGFQIVDKLINPKKAIDVCKHNSIDLLFLDIQMPQINGIELLKKLPYQPITIFTTAHNNFAALAYELNVVDYLVKPYSFERFLNCMHKAEKALENITVEGDRTLQVKADGLWVNIPYAAILYIEGWKEYVRIHCINKIYTVLKSMSSLEALLPNEAFIRIHKSYIVATSAVTGFNAEEIGLSNEIKLPISRKKKEYVTERLKRN